MSDPVGTVRCSADGVVAVKTGGSSRLEANAPWLASQTADRRAVGGAKHSYWRNDDEVEDWDVVYSPPPPVGTVMRRKVLHGPGKGWEVAIHAHEGWVWVNHNGVVDRFADQPYDDDEGAWAVIHA